MEQLNQRLNQTTPNGKQAKCASTTGVTEKHAFATTSPGKQSDRTAKARGNSGKSDAPYTGLWIGIAIRDHANGTLEIGFACHDGTYDIDFAVHILQIDSSSANGHDEDSPSSNVTAQASELADYLVSTIRSYEEKHRYKFHGVGISHDLLELSPQAPARLWRELDIVPVLIDCGVEGHLRQAEKCKVEIGVDELADSLARKCLYHFTMSSQPRLQVGFNNMVEVDLGGRARLTDLDEYRQSVSPATWNAAIHYAWCLKERKKKFAFFSATPQGGGVALMRHALLRFFRILGVDCTWWVPKPKPEVFRITKTNHNILQGVAHSSERLTADQQKTIEHWIDNNAERFWTRNGGPLASRENGGMDVIICDDPQMPHVVDWAKKMDPERPVIFRSHIQVRSDLAAQPGTPTAEVWNWLWNSVQHADLFISHPVKDFVPRTVRAASLAYMPATTDWLDGLNKPLSEYDTNFYLREFNDQCQRQGMPTLDHPKRDYIIQIARFDPSKGIPHVLAAYAEFRRKSSFCHGKPASETPQLVICGHYSVDDPDGAAVLEQTLEALDSAYCDIKDSIIAMRLGPTEQLLNALLINAKVALQLSTREGFEVKVSEALHKRVPVIATTAGGIPLQVQHEESGFLVEPGDASAVAKHLDTLFDDQQRHQKMSDFAAANVSDEVSTVGNAVCWMYLADRLSRDPAKVRGCGRWIWDLAREESAEPRRRTETWLPRDRTT